MGIQGLAKLLGDVAPGAVREQQMKHYFGRKIAIDASMSIYQFLIAVRQDGNVLQNEAGETTSHLMGMFYRTIRMVENGIKPVYVFDGKPPDLKSAELNKRSERRAEAEKQLAAAQESGECMRAHFYGERRKFLSKGHEGTILTPRGFVDLCILLGSDYCESIRGIGPKRAIELIRQHRTIEEILKHIDSSKFTIPEDWLYKEARRLFLEPEVVNTDSVELKWVEPDEEELVKFMCNEKQFSEERIRNGAKKLLKGRQGCTQGRLDDFFKVTGSLTSAKRKVWAQGSAKKKPKTGGKFKKGK
ncbi:flap endonuclease 1 [Stegostoma tigrinum]|uniref:flap endonuclease 1 n=1 Tax=Stegostoma tigrinum TaxID=3053191 RepID=UPI0028705BB5|nr:flap endonuclease 1 [Stegostoma tigrinum]